jgi:hypothetical protein
VTAAFPNEVRPPSLAERHRDQLCKVVENLLYLLDGHGGRHRPKVIEDARYSLKEIRSEMRGQTWKRPRRSLLQVLRGWLPRLRKKKAEPEIVYSVKEGHDSLANLIQQDGDHTRADVRDLGAALNLRLDDLHRVGSRHTMLNRKHADKIFALAMAGIEEVRDALWCRRSLWTAANLIERERSRIRPKSVADKLVAILRAGGKDDG